MFGCGLGMHIACCHCITVHNTLGRIDSALVMSSYAFIHLQWYEIKFRALENVFLDHHQLLSIR